MRFKLVEDINDTKFYTEDEVIDAIVREFNKNKFYGTAYYDTDYEMDHPIKVDVDGLDITSVKFNTVNYYGYDEQVAKVDANLIGDGGWAYLPTYFEFYTAMIHDDKEGFEKLINDQITNTLNNDYFEVEDTSEDDYINSRIDSYRGK